MAVTALAVLLLTYQATSQEQRLSLEQQVAEIAADAKAVADPLADLCRTDPSVAARAGEACQKAAEVKSEPVPRPVNGTDGRGIQGTDIVDGRLVIYYTDGTRDDKGRVVGQAGAAGGAGRGIVASTINDGRLVLAYTDGAREDIGQVVGAQGDAGEDGATGRGIAAVDGSSGRLLITYTDGTTADAGPLPPGPAGPRGEAGPAGRGVQRAYVEDCRWYVLYTDGTSQDAGNACTTETAEPPETTPPDDGGLLPTPNP